MADASIEASGSQIIPEQSKSHEEIINTFDRQMKIAPPKKMTTRRTAGQRQSIIGNIDNLDEPVGFGNDFVDMDKHREILEKETFKGIMRILREH